MKFLTFVDLHLNKKGLQELVQRARKPDIDFIICAGDVSWFGKGFKDFLKAFSKAGKTMYIIPGNHEEAEDVLDTALKGFPYCVSLHKKAVEVGGYVFMGYGGGGFSREDEGFRKVAREWYGKYNGRKVVLVTHGPPLNTTLDILE